MNECPKCAGLLVAERDLIDGESIKCLNCGWTRGAEAMPRFKTEEDRHAWVAKIRATRAKNKSRKGSAQALPSGRGTGARAAALEEIESKITALEQVKRNLMQAQELVNL